MSIAETDKVAIIGIGLTFPGGAQDPLSFWELMVNKRDATREIPESRWDIRRFYAPYGSDKPGKMYVKRGGFLQEEAGAFDPTYYGISPREASVMDFQQRLLLEVTSKALQDAGLTESDYRQSNMGVFIGGFCMDAKIEDAYNRNWVLSHSVTGNTATLLSNRLSYFLDIKGPSMTIDTACSSSLVATHLACKSLLAGECSSALVGGVNMMTQPEHFINMCKGRLLSEDGRCFTWDVRANGYARGEGAGILVLKRVSQAVADGDHIYAVIEASGVNQDGTTQGISQPNSHSQSSLIRQILKEAEINPNDIAYVEAHGTGTQAGDKAETSALHEVFSSKRSDKLIIGSVKTNIGHLEAAAGVASLIKACLILKNRSIPPNLHFETPNPEIPFDRMNLQVPTTQLELPQLNGLAHVGVNSFGYGGTNAHVVLHTAPMAKKSQCATHVHNRPVDNSDCPSRPILLPLSAHNQESLLALAEQYARCVKQYSDTLPAFLRRVSVKRNHYEYRALLQADNEHELIGRLEQFAQGHQTEGVAYVPGAAPKTAAAQSSEKGSVIVFVFSGMGPQWWGMGQTLLAREPVFKAAITECDAIFQSIAGWSLLQAMSHTETDSQMSHTSIAQPCNFAVQVGLTALWRSWGIKPSAVVGHSVGEVAAAYVAGILSLEEALRVSYHRSRLQASLAGKGGMLAIGMSKADAQAFIHPVADRVAIAAVNAPSSVTLAGDLEALDNLASECQSKGIFNRSLKVEVAYHSPLMAPIETKLKTELADISPQAPKVACYSTVTGGGAIVDEYNSDFNADYWWANVRKTVLFADAIESLCEDGYRCFLEVGPHPVLTNSIKETVSELGIEAEFHTSLNRKTDEIETLLHSLGQLYSYGHTLDWKTLQPDDDQYLQLPPYPWQKSHFSNSSPKVVQDKQGDRAHPILYRDLQLPLPTWEAELTDTLFPYLKDHRIGGRIVVPGAFYVEAALAMQAHATGERKVCLRHLSFERMLTVADKMDAEENRLQSCMDLNRGSFWLYSTTTAREETWTLNAHGELGDPGSNTQSVCLNHPEITRFETLDVARFYQGINETGLSYGKAFRLIRHLASYAGWIYAELEDQAARDEHTILPPTILDSVFQTFFVFGGQHPVPFVPIKIKQLQVLREVPSRCKIICKLSWITATSMQADALILDEHNQVVVDIQGVTCQALSSMGDDETESLPLYQTEWRQVSNPSQQIEPAPQPDQSSPQQHGPHTALLASDSNVADRIKSALSTKHDSVEYIPLHKSSRTIFESAWKARPFDRILFLFTARQNDMASLFGDVVDYCTLVSEIVQFLHENVAGQSVELVVCTQNACQAMDTDTLTGVTLSPLWGLCRGINTEHPEIVASCIDLDTLDSQECVMLADNLAQEGINVREHAIRGAKLFEHVMAPIGEQTTEMQVVASSPGQGVTLSEWPTSDTTEISFRPLHEPDAISDDEVLIHIEKMVLSRWDVANGRLSVYPGNPEENFFKFRPGMQCLGVVSRRGAVVSNLAVQDRVLALYPVGVGNLARVPDSYAIRLPDAWQGEAGLRTLPDMYELARAAYALKRMGPLRQNQRLLIRGVWGDFTQLLIRRALDIGLEIIFADDQADESTRQRLTGLNGVKYIPIAQSQSPIGSDEWMETLADSKIEIDLFINDGSHSLVTPSFLTSSAQVVDFVFDQLDVDVRSTGRQACCTLHRINMDELFRTQFSMLKALLIELLGELADGSLVLEPNPSFPMRDLSSAINEMQESNMASVVVEMKDQSVPLPALPGASEPINSQGTYIITGGTRGFGLTCAKWLASRGAQHLVLVSRSGATAETEAELPALLKAGVEVKLLALDITQESAVKEAIAQIGCEMPPVRGVIHSAMVLDDDFVRRMDSERYHRVMAPKMLGAIHLNTVLGSMPLDFMLMFSSVSSLIGNSGQANYIAANSFLDAYASALRLNGVPATSINWGALSESGILAQDESLVKVLALQGITGLTNDEAMSVMEHVLTHDIPSHVGAFHIDWRQWSSVNSALARSTFYSELCGADTDQDERLIEILEDILELDHGQRVTYMVSKIQELFSTIFHIPAASVDPHVRIIQLGVDSLTAAEIVVAMKESLCVDVVLVDLLAGPTIEQMAERASVQLEAFIETDSHQLEEIDADQLISDKDLSLEGAS
jgi:acyl transferase domain-containing protein/NAD(P)-dependent dehydrogenase (short-subunit alcohol dehydrogenase family)/acyl carrier protein